MYVVVSSIVWFAATRKSPVSLVVYKYWFQYQQSSAFTAYSNTTIFNPQITTRTGIFLVCYKWY